MLGKFTQLPTNCERVVFDIETFDPFLKDTGASWVRKAGQILGIGVKIGSSDTEYYPVGHNSGNYDKDQVKKYINDIWVDSCHGSYPIVGHYLYYDLGWMNHEGYIDLEWGMKNGLEIFDTLVSSQVYDSSLSAYSLAYMAKHFKVGEKMDVDVNQLRLMPISAVERYCCSDVTLTDRVCARLLEQGNLFADALDRENNVIPILIMMHKNGIRIDMEELVNIELRLKKQLKVCMDELLTIEPGIKIWSGTSIEMLFRKLGLGYPRTDKGNPSFDQDFLEAVGKVNPTIAAMSQARKLHRLINNFIFGISRLQVDGILHPDYFNGRSEYGGTVTGRLSSANPNIQQMPNRTEEGKTIREAFVGFPGEMWSRHDYSQQEPRIILHYASRLALTGIDEWKKRYESNPDQDFYNILMELANRKDRFEMKTMTLAVLYGMGPKRLATSLGIDENASQDLLQLFFKGVPWMKEEREYIMKQVRTNRAVRTLGNRTLRFLPNTDNKAFNHLIQGSAADQTKQAMLDVFRQTGKIPLCQVHDELNYSLNEDEIGQELDVKIEDIMKNTFSLDFPTKVDSALGSNWREACG